MSANVFSQTPQSTFGPVHLITEKTIIQKYRDRYIMDINITLKAGSHYRIRISVSRNTQTQYDADN